MGTGARDQKFGFGHMGFRKLTGQVNEEIKEMDIQVWSSGQVWDGKSPFGIYHHMDGIYVAGWGHPGSGHKERKKVGGGGETVLEHPDVQRSAGRVRPAERCPESRV